MHEDFKNQFPKAKFHDNGDPMLETDGASMEYTPPEREDTKPQFFAPRPPAGAIDNSKREKKAKIQKITNDIFQLFRSKK